MKKAILFAIAALFSAQSFAAPYCDNNEIVFYGMSANHKKEVTICKVPNGFSYNFAKVGGESEKYLVAADNVAEVMASSNVDGAIETITIPTGNINYVVGFTSVEGAPAQGYNLVVQKNYKPIAIIKLDENTVMNNIRQYQ